MAGCSGTSRPGAMAVSAGNGEVGGRVHSGRSLWRQRGFDIEHRRGSFNPKMHPPMAPGKQLLQCELAHTVSAELRVM
ncbi:MAG: hypothetical protein QOJ15_8382 [Bradyrhizobium sp.]|jgi:hypothetical protein|nr:hypothetical protein [Bradyrhizobium sp.]